MGEMLISIPDNAMISSVHPAYQAKCGNYFKTDNIVDEENFCFAYYICDSKKSKDSYFKNYVDTMPEIMSDYVFDYTDEDRALIRHTQFEKNVTILENKIKEKYELISKNLYPKFSFEEFVICTYQVTSRAFPIKNFHNKTQGFAMMPLGDMINYSFYPNAQWYYSESEKTFFMQFTKDIKMGEEVNYIFYYIQILIDYEGQTNNLEALLLFGFTMKNNIKGSPIYLNYNDYETILNFDKINMKTALSIYRKNNSIEIVNVEDERSALNSFINELQNRLAKFETTLEEDTKQLEIAEIEDNTRKINIYRILVEEKKYYYYILYQPL